MSDSVQQHRQQPTRLLCPWDSPGKNIGVCCYFLLHGRKLRGTKELLDEGKRGEWKSRLKTEHLKNEDHGIQSHHFMAYRWGHNGNSTRLYFLGLQNLCRWWLQPWNLKMLTPWIRKAMTNLDSILKSRDITLPTKVRLVKAMVFPVVMYGCESWTIKEAEHWRIDAFGGREVQDRGHMYTHSWFMWMYGKNHYNIVK